MTSGTEKFGGSPAFLFYSYVSSHLMLFSISTNIGEMKYYFTHEKNALLADAYDPGKFSKLINFVIENPHQSKVIGKNGRSLNLSKYKLGFQILIKVLSVFPT